MIERYVSNVDKDVFALSGLPEEVIAVLFAYYSRSPNDLRTNLAALLADDELGIAAEPGESSFANASEKARNFHEKWVVGFGHSSVAEHACVHLAIENVSILASKVIEDMRLGSFTEKSTRFVKFGPQSFVNLPELPDSLRDVYETTAKELFAAYADAYAIVKRQEENCSYVGYPTEAQLEMVAHKRTCDTIRGLLPAGTKTNLGLTANARALSGLLSKMLASPLREARNVAASMLCEARKVAPTLLNHVEPRDWERRVTQPLRGPYEMFNDKYRSVNPVHVVACTDRALELIVLGLTYDQLVSHEARTSFDLLCSNHSASREAMAQELHNSMSSRGPHDAVPRAFEAVNVTLELELDYGAYRDLQRHRMLSPCVQVLTCDLGYDLPAERLVPGLTGIMARARDAWEQLAEHDLWTAQYVVPLAYRVRVLWTLNLREAIHIIELRSGPQGHPSYRRVAKAMRTELCKIYPWLDGIIRQS